ncbi:VOC family protein [Colwellia sp. 6_MG-2023]|uniref:VOC family protein n=1 Tax=Colwellia sp. 6_MG-2023 TaxID=3062676 RepID=UPI0026E2E7DD|nr:VOC family protein [Colwellia sp. 6_MG-2023]MDO6486824.1 VOC family protein [Colwellia sp. 6_MG-2023]
MRLEHINLVVSDIKESLRFYQAALPHWKIRSEGVNQWSGVERNWLHFGDDYQYIALNDNGIGENRDLSGHQVGLAHFSFVTNNLEAVILRLKKVGFEIAKPGAVNTFRKNVYFLDSNGYEIEFVQYLSDLPEERNNDD